MVKLRILFSFFLFVMLLFLFSCNVTDIENNDNVKHDHKYEIKILQEVGCEYSGEYKYVCNCGDFYIEKISSLGHKYGDWIISKPATFDSQGVIHRVCTLDPNHIEEKILPKLDDKNYEYTIIKQATDKESGIGKYTYILGEQVISFEVNIKPINHKYDEGVIVREATCTSSGYKKYTCYECGTTYEEIIPMIDHKFSAWEIEEEPNLETSGKLKRICLFDNSHFELIDIPKISVLNGYTYSVEIEPSCIKNGKGVYCYNKDGQKFIFSVVINKLDHNYSKWNLIEEPTIDREGKLEAICLVDSPHSAIIILPKLSTTNGYTYEVVIPATNTTDGLGRYTYKKGEQTFSFDVIITANTTEFDPR